MTVAILDLEGTTFTCDAPAGCAAKVHVANRIGDHDAKEAALLAKGWVKTRTLELLCPKHAGAG